MTKRKRRGGRVTESTRTTPTGTTTGKTTGPTIGNRTALTLPRSAVMTPRTGAVKPGVVSLRRTVPDTISKPPYAISGQPPARGGSDVQTPEIISRMRVAGALAAEVLIEVGDAITPGITTDELDAITHAAALARDCYPSPLNYRGFPKSVCTSVNEVICHGIPDSRPLVEGDIVNIDVTVFHGGVHGDTNCTFFVGDVDAESRRLVLETRTAMYRGIEAVKPGGHVYDIGRAIEEHSIAADLGVVREFIGHGIGEQFHGGLQILHYFDTRADNVIETGMTFTIEPMITLGSPELRIWDDKWTAVTRDGSRSAQFEHTLVVTDRGAEILTVTADGRCAADRYDDL
ncbi:MAG: type I methionyl aminopeptidase [Actinomycetes bacterium]